ALCADASGNAIVAWEDLRSGSIQNIYAQRIDRFGTLGNAEPAITKIRDVKADQGGQVRIDWSASWLDANPTFGIGTYWIWRQTPAAQAQDALDHGARLVDADDLASLARAMPEALAAAIIHGLITRTTIGAVQYNWEYL